MGLGQRLCGNCPTFKVLIGTIDGFSREWAQFAKERAENATVGETRMQNYFLSSYDTLSKEGMDHGQLGATALQRAARLLKKSLGSWRTTGRVQDREQLMEALNKNQRLWTILQVESVNPECSMPQELRQNLLQLSRYIDKVTAQCIVELDEAKMETMIRINENLAEGLIGYQETQMQQQQPVAAAAVVAGTPAMTFSY